MGGGGGGGGQNGGGLSGPPLATVSPHTRAPPSPLDISPSVFQLPQPCLHRFGIQPPLLQPGMATPTQAPTKGERRLGKGCRGAPGS